MVNINLDFTMKTLPIQIGQALMIILVLLSGCNKQKDEGVLPEIITSAVDIITPVSAICSGNIASTGGPVLSERGVCWSTAHLPVITDNKVSGGTETGQFSFVMTGLTPQTEYFARAFATNSTGTAYGEELQFTTTADHTGETGTVEDADGNTYQTIGIGSQIWITENLKTTRFNDGTSISQVAENSAWSLLTGPGYCWYENDEAANKETYGALYNWFTVISSKLCPVGWHVPTDADWTILETFLGGSGVAGRKTKEAGTSHWISPNTGATNETDFSGLPGGMRAKDGTFSGKSESGTYWSSTEASNLSAWYRTQFYQNDSLSRGSKSILWGFSVRSVKD
jgi:uncharacterized protein (TIGR02145 family)